MMDEIELRVQVLELVMLELLPWSDPLAIDDALRSIEAGMEGCCGDELAVRRGAAAMLREGRTRFARLAG